MIPRIPVPEHRPDWQAQLAGAIRRIDELLDCLDIDPARFGYLQDGTGFPLRVPRSLVQRMKKGDPNDPLLLQVLPRPDEQRACDGYQADPLQELDAMPVAGLLHKYHGRVLLTLTGACGVHCRYCFRRHYPYTEARPAGELSGVLEYLAARPEITEIILSGGDPLSLATQRLRELTDRLCELPQLDTLRIHTRLPVVLPDRVDAPLLDWLKQLRPHCVMVLHCNHGNEIDAAVRAALQRLRSTGTLLLNQSVLLRGVNDSAATLAQLSRTLFDCGVLPYYLHMLDRVQGAAHFAVTTEAATGIMSRLRERLPGYLVPRLVEERPGTGAKTVLG